MMTLYFGIANDCSRGATSQRATVLWTSMGFGAGKSAVSFDDFERLTLSIVLPFPRLGRPLSTFTSFRKSSFRRTNPSFQESQSYLGVLALICLCSHKLRP